MQKIAGVDSEICVGLMEPVIVIDSATQERTRGALHTVAWHRLSMCLEWATNGRMNSLVTLSVFLGWESCTVGTAFHA